MSMASLSHKLRPLMQQAVQHQPARAMTILSKQSAEEYKQLNYTTRMKKTGRPVSPHVTIYAFPLSALSSITNRLTGFALSMGAGGLGAIELLGGPGSALAVMETIGSQGVVVASGAKFCVSFPLVYHYLAGLRHFAWDFTPSYLENEGVHKTSIILVGSATAISGVFLFL